MVEQLLAIQGHQVVCTANGQEALKIIERQAIDLVITDIIMPHIRMALTTLQ
jgi:CheY-like chemotaxis protein